MEEYACTSSGLTAMGFYQILNQKYKPDKIMRKLRRFGINENFYSVKSSIFIDFVSFWTANTVLAKNYVLNKA